MDQPLTPNKLSRSGYGDPVPEVGLTVSLEMTKSFANFTGDFSSLHMDADLGRASAFCTTGAPDKLPILFILSPSICWKPGKGNGSKNCQEHF